VDYPSYLSIYAVEKKNPDNTNPNDDMVQVSTVLSEDLSKEIMPSTNGLTPIFVSVRGHEGFIHDWGALRQLSTKTKLTLFYNR